MRTSRIGIALAAIALFCLTIPDTALARDHSSRHRKADTSQKAKKPNGKNGLKSFSELTKDKVVIDGLFTFYKDTTDNSVLMAVTPEQIGPVYLMSMARAAGDGTFYDTGPLGRTFPFYFKRVGKKIQVIEKNLRIRADSTSTLADAIPRGISDHLFASTAVKSTPDDSTKAVLIEASPLFVRDAENTGYYLGTRAHRGIGFDKSNSYVKTIKSFPENSEIDAILHFTSKQPNGGASLQSGQSFFHRYHYSMSSLPETDYVPRLGDDRIGYFQTMYQDYSTLDQESPYVRYVQRWDLKKKNPDARISEPVEPIVFWVDKAVPEEYRDAVAEGIEFWNPAFEKIGFRNAVIAKQMPDTADWDPLDVRYNTIRWMISNGVYAIGPSRANPFTGQIYDADISLSVDFIRAMFNNMENFISPVSYDGTIMEDPDIHEQLMDPEHERNCCAVFAKESAKEAAFGLSYLLSSAGAFVDKDSLTREYVHSYLVEVIAHEVGHTLGFRHNFKASTIYTLEQLSDREFTREHSTTGTIMEYPAANIAAKGEPQGEFYASVPGPFDYWRVEYGYRDFGAEKPEDEIEQLQKIASRSADPLLAYATDFDRSGGGVDPYVNVFDLGADPLAFCEHRIRLTKELWNNSISEFEKPGESYEKIRRVFGNGWRSYRETALFASRFIGGLHHNKNHIGDPGGDIPFRPVAASEQRRAINLISKHIFAADAFDLPEDLLNKLQPNRGGDFVGTIYRSPLDYPWHQRVLNIQAASLATLYNPRTLGRLINNMERYKAGEEMYTMYDLFTDVRKAIWGEVVNASNVNSYRRQLQLAHLQRITNIYLSGPVIYPSDARTLAANDLDVIESAARKAMDSKSINSMTWAHFKEIVRQIEAAKNAQKTYSRF